LLASAFADPARWEREIRLLDRIAQAYGLFSPRSLAEIEERNATLGDLAEQLRNVSSAWRGAWYDASEANWLRFVEANEGWAQRLSALDGSGLSDAERDRVAEELIPQLLAFTRGSDSDYRLLRLLRRKTKASAAARYRLEVRQGVLQRLERQLTRLAGLVWIEREASDAERQAFAALARCEEWRLPDRDLPHPDLLLPRPFPPFEDDVARVQRALPAWMGIQFREPSEEARRQFSLARGAAAVTTVYPDSPAARAGIRQGDFLLGPPGAHFRDKGEVRRWIMLSRIGEAKSLELLRDGERQTVTLVPAAYPLKWPALPGPPAVGSNAPALPALAAYRGEVPTLGQGQPLLLFFWASWCAACKAALPEVLAFERERQVPVLAITDEAKERLDGFFARSSLTFPARIAIDEYRKAFVAYGVSSTPTFVLIDPGGRIELVHTGYDQRKGLPIEGWKWNR
jgi:thiol-disulfide isomerase/thioredoxin